MIDDDCSQIESTYTTSTKGKSVSSRSSHRLLMAKHSDTAGAPTQVQQNVSHDLITDTNPTYDMIQYSVTKQGRRGISSSAGFFAQILIRNYFMLALKMHLPFTS